MQIHPQTPSSLPPSSPITSPSPLTSETLSPLLPYSHLLFHPTTSLQRLLPHIHSIFQAITLIQKFTGPYQTALSQNVQKLSECLEQPQNIWTHQKALFIDIDDTLLTRVDTKGDGCEMILVGTEQIYFKIRPFAIQFLIKMSQYYDLILFSASEQIYSQSFFTYLNRHTGNCIKQYLSRDFCIRAYKNVYFKDLRVIKSKQLKDVVLMDNSVFSFGVLIENGVPVVGYGGEEGDRELEGVMEYLMEMSGVEDVREFNKERLRLREIVRGIRGE